MNLDRDAALIALANGCYRWLASRVRGYDKAAPKPLYRRFVETGGVVETSAEQVLVHFGKRSHNPLHREGTFDRGCLPIKWIGNLLVAFRDP